MNDYCGKQAISIAVNERVPEQYYVPYQELILCGAFDLAVT